MRTISNSLVRKTFYCAGHLSFAVQMPVPGRSSYFYVIATVMKSFAAAYWAPNPVNEVFKCLLKKLLIGSRHNRLITPMPISEIVTHNQTLYSRPE